MSSKLGLHLRRRASILRKSTRLSSLPRKRVWLTSSFACSIVYIASAILTLAFWFKRNGDLVIAFKHRRTPGCVHARHAACVRGHDRTRTYHAVCILTGRACPTVIASRVRSRVRNDALVDTRCQKTQQLLIPIVTCVAWFTFLASPTQLTSLFISLLALPLIKSLLCL